jgi:hypothetical protein
MILGTNEKVTKNLKNQMAVLLRRVKNRNKLQKC